jgi:GST-like protein
MIDLHFWPTPNGYKPLIALEEWGLPYAIRPVNIFRGAQFDPAFLAVAPNNRIPAITDDGAPGGPLALFESGAILLYLAEIAGQVPTAPQVRHEQQQWLFWQMGGLGPMMGQASHFLNDAPDDVPYGKRRYVAETVRLFGVMERRLADRPFLAGGYSIADMACFPWVRLHGIVGIALEPAFPALADWVRRIAARPAVQRAYAAGEPIRGAQVMDAEARPHLFGQPPR